MKKLLPLLILLLFFINCKKDDDSEVESEETSTEIVETNAEIEEKVVVIYKESSEIISTELELTNGVYKIQFSQNPPIINNGDIIVGDENEGFLRKVITASVDGNVISMQTEQANMEQLFKNATLEFSSTIEEGRGKSQNSNENIKINYLAAGVKISTNGLNYDFSNTVLYQEEGLTFEITNGTASFEPNFQFKSEYSLLGGLNYFKFGTDNASLNIDCDLALNATAGVSLPEFTKPLASFDKNLLIIVGGVPVTVVINTTLEAKLNANISSEFNINTGFTNNYILSTGIKKENGTWSSNFDLTPTLIPKPVTLDGQVNISQSLAIVPRVSVKFFGKFGPFCEPALVEEFAYNIASPSLDWDSNIQVGVDLKTGVDIEIFGFGDDYSITNHFKDTIWSAPKNLEKVFGDNQEGNPGEELPEPIKIKITDPLNNSLSNVPIYFQVTQGGGTLQDTSVLTDENGFAETFWTLGETGIQKVDVYFKDHTETVVGESLKTFIANLYESNSKWYKLDLLLETLTTDFCYAQENKRYKVYLNVTDENNILLNKLYFRKIDNIIGVPNKDFDFQGFEQSNTGIIYSEFVDTTGDSQGVYGCCNTYPDPGYYNGFLVYFNDINYSFTLSHTLATYGINYFPECEKTCPDGSTCFVTSEYYAIAEYIFEYIGINPPSDL